MGQWSPDNDDRFKRFYSFDNLLLDEDYNGIGTRLRQESAVVMNPTSDHCRNTSGRCRDANRCAGQHA